MYRRCSGKQYSIYIKMIDNSNGLFNNTYEKESIYPRILSGGCYDSRSQIPILYSLLIKRDR